MMNPTTFDTGRTYNGPQVLTITPVLVQDADEFGFFEGVVRFDDPSRHLSGLVRALFSVHDSARDIGRTVLYAYDRCQYTEV